MVDSHRDRSWRGFGRYAAAALACAATTAVAWPLTRLFDLANIVMLFLLTVVLIAVRCGRGPAIVSAFLCVALFDFFFVPPTLSFTVHDAQYLLTFAVMLVVALVTGSLTATLREQANLASAREARSAALYGMARDLSGALTIGQAADFVRRFLADVIGGTAAIYVPDERGELRAVEGTPTAVASKFDAPILELVMQKGEYVRLDFQAYFPLRAADRLRGVLAVRFEPADAPALEDQHDLLAAVASLAAIVLERLHYVEVAQESQLQAQTERLRSSILSALSHDIRTPLTALIGLADALSVARGLSPRDAETACAIRDQARRLAGLVTNLLNMAKLNAGEVRLRREWQPLEEVVGSSLKLLALQLRGRPVRIDLPDDLPLIELDAVLVERVLCNLIENAAKYSPEGSAIEIAACEADEVVEVSVRDHGPGVDPAQRQRIFEMFVRGEKESSRPGVGLGLAISRAIVESHGGTLRVGNEPSGGARFTFTLPKGEPPAIDGDLAGAAAV